MPTITRSEWMRVWVLALIVVAVPSVPYALGFARSDVQHVYSGATLDLVDYNSYRIIMAGVMLYTLSRHELAGRALLSVSRHVLVLSRLYSVGSGGAESLGSSPHSLSFARAIPVLDGRVFLMGYAE